VVLPTSPFNCLRGWREYSHFEERSRPICPPPFPLEKPNNQSPWAVVLFFRFLLEDLAIQQPPFIASPKLFRPLGINKDLRFFSIPLSLSLERMKDVSHFPSAFQGRVSQVASLESHRPLFTALLSFPAWSRGSPPPSCWGYPFQSEFRTFILRNQSGSISLCPPFFRTTWSITGPPQSLFPPWGSLVLFPRP